MKKTLLTLLVMSFALFAGAQSLDELKNKKIERRMATSGITKVSSPSLGKM